MIILEGFKPKSTWFHLGMSRSWTWHLLAGSRRICMRGSWSYWTTFMGSGWFISSWEEYCGIEPGFMAPNVRLVSIHVDVSSSKWNVTCTCLTCMGGSLVSSTCTSMSIGLIREFLPLYLIWWWSWVHKHILGTT